MLARLLMLYVFGITVLGCGAPDPSGAPNPENFLTLEDQNKNPGILSASETDYSNESANSLVLLSQKDLGTLCTGVIIDKHVVLTAAHCASGTAEQSVVLFTLDYFGKDIPLRQAKKFLVHEDYGKTKGADRKDLALILFEGNLPKGFKPMEVAKRSELESLLANQKTFEFMAFGYGQSDKNQKYNGNAGLLRTATFLVQNFDLNKNYFVVEQVSGPALCHGDSGGPGIVKVGDQLRLVGLASAVFGKDPKIPTADPCRFKALYMNLINLKPWLIKNVNLIKSLTGPGQVP